MPPLAHEHRPASHLTPEQIRRIANNKEAAKRRRDARKARLTPEMMAMIAVKREAAKQRKAARAAEQIKIKPLDLQPLTQNPGRGAPATWAPPSVDAICRKHGRCTL